MSKENQSPWVGGPGELLRHGQGNWDMQITPELVQQVRDLAKRTFES